MLEKVISEAGVAGTSVAVAAMAGTDRAGAGANAAPNPAEDAAAAPVDFSISFIAETCIAGTSTAGTSTVGIWTAGTWCAGASNPAGAVAMWSVSASRACSGAGLVGQPDAECAADEVLSNDGATGKESPRA